MDRIGKYIEIIKKNKKVRERIFYISLITAFFILIIVIKNPDEQGTLVYDNSGNVVGIQRNSLENVEEYSLILSFNNGDSLEKKSVELELEANDNDAEDESDAEEESIIERDAEIDGIITDIELSGKRKITLPSRLSDGTRLKWTSVEKKDNTWVVVLGSYILLIVFSVKSANDEIRNEGKKNRKEIMSSLPRFTNQLLLMLNAGMILSDAFEKISLSYMLMEENEKGYFERSLIQIYEKNVDSRASTAFLLSEFASENSVKELMRICTILTENEKRGSDIVDNLSRESNYLWDERKIVARESGKLIDTKMTYPLGILLILLIVITMAPALLGI